MTEETTPQAEDETRSVYISGGATPLATSVAALLVEAGHSVALQVNGSDGANAARAAGALPVYGDADNVTLVADNLTLAEADTVLNLAPARFLSAPVGRRNWEADAAALTVEMGALKAAVTGNEAITTVVHISSTLAYEESEEPVAEDAPLSHDSHPFIAALVAVEADAAEMNAVVLRTGYLFGTSDADPLVGFEKTLRRGLTPSFFGKPGAKAGWLRTEDLVSAVMAALDAEPGAYNVVIDDQQGVYAFLLSLGEKLGLSLPSNMPAPLARGIVGKHFVTLASRSTPASNAHAKASLGWSPRFADVDAALEDMLLTWRTHA
jgi:nucleoside-diphosphate-sugar epimerase